MDSGAERKTVRVTIFNQTYTLAATDEAGEVETLAQTVDELMTSIAQRAGNMDAQRIAVLACLHLADRLGAPWYAVYVKTPSEELDRIDAAAQRHISNTLTLTKQMGGTPMEFKGRDVVSTVAAFANEYAITHIVLGRTGRNFACSE
jgi:two-component system sensor histidine kinase KdpD